MLIKKFVELSIQVITLTSKLETVQSETSCLERYRHSLANAGSLSNHRHSSANLGDPSNQNLLRDRNIYSRIGQNFDPNRYFSSHVFKVKETHTYATCRYLLDGHNKLATRLDNKGGKTWNKYFSFQWNPHAPWPLLQEVHHLYWLLLRVMVAVIRYLVSETTGFLVTYSGSSFVDFLGEFPPELFIFDLQSFWIWKFLPHLWQVISDLSDDLLPDPLSFPLWLILK